MRNPTISTYPLLHIISRHHIFKQQCNQTPHSRLCFITTTTNSNQPPPSSFAHILPPSRLGISHPNLTSYQNSIYNHRNTTTNSPTIKQSTLIVVTDSPKRHILLGLKNRGFGKGFYNSFGGSLLPNEHPTFGAVRELSEETGIIVDSDTMERGYRGTLSFTFDDDVDVKMVVNLFRVEVDVVNDDIGEMDESLVGDVVTRVSRGSVNACDDEITPRWFDDWYDIPLNQMFVDDSVWLTRLLMEERERPLALNGWFHFAPGGVEVNSIMDYYLDVTEKR